MAGCMEQLYLVCLSKLQSRRSLANIPSVQLSITADLTHSNWLVNCDDQFPLMSALVVKTLDRKTLWEMQTPQVIKPALLKEGLDLVNRKGLEVTDDVSIVEHLGHPVFITEGSYTNIKTPKHKGDCRSCYSPSISDTLRRKGGNLLRGSQKDNHKQPGSLSRSKKQKIHSQMVKGHLPLLSNSCDGGGESSFGTVNSDDELSTNFGELNLEGLSRLDGRRWSASYRSQDSSDFIAASGEGEEESSSENIRSLSQRYQPIFFDELIGKNIVVQSLMNSISKGRVAPVYLFPGPRCYCLATEGTKPCGICRDCSDFISGRSKDLVEVDGSNKKAVD